MKCVKVYTVKKKISIINFYKWKPITKDEKILVGNVEVEGGGVVVNPQKLLPFMLVCPKM